MSAENVVQQRPYSFCLVDEVDSILVDEARTPLIISRKGKMPNDKHISSAQIAKELIKDKHYEVDLKNQKVELTQAGFKFCEQVYNCLCVQISSRRDNNNDDDDDDYIYKYIVSMYVSMYVM